jgi:hypothetical protein
MPKRPRSTRPDALRYVELLRLRPSLHTALCDELRLLLRHEGGHGAPAALTEALTAAVEAHAAAADAVQARRRAARALAGASAEEAAGLAALDAAVDQALGALFRKCTTDAEVYGAGEPEGRAAAQLITALLPGGLAAHTQLPRSVQAGENRRVADALRGGAWDAQIAQAHAGALVERALRAIDAYEAAHMAALLRGLDARPATPAALAAAEDELHQGLARLYLRLAAACLDDAGRARRLLGPLHRLQEARRLEGRLGPRRKAGG